MNAVRPMLITLLLAGTAAAKGPPLETMRRDVRANLNKDWVRKSTQTVEPVGSVVMTEDYLGPRDRHTTTFYHQDFDVLFSFRDGTRKRCPFTVIYYQKGGWRLDRADSQECTDLARDADQPPDVATVNDLAAQALLSYLHEKNQFIDATEVRNLHLVHLFYKNFGDSIAHVYGGEFDIGDSHCYFCDKGASGKCLDTGLVDVQRKTGEAAWRSQVWTWPACVKKP